MMPAKEGAHVGFVEMFLIAIGLSMDAFAVSICKGLGMRRMNVGQAALIALFFGVFQALMPLVGWFAGAQFAHFVSTYAHWIAFALLAFVGGKMLWDACHNQPGEEEANGSALDLAGLFMLAIATSIDALAVGVSFAFLDVAIAPSVLLIGATTFALSFGGVFIGHQFGARWEKPATIVGSVVLLAIGLKVLLEGFGIL